MAKGDIKSRIMQGQQPGLAPINPMMNAISPTEGAMGINNPSAPISGQEMIDQGNARIMPMQSGTLQTQGKHPIGTNKQRMLKYNSPTGY